MNRERAGAAGKRRQQLTRIELHGQGHRQQQMYARHIVVLRAANMREEACVGLDSLAGPVAASCAMYHTKHVVCGTVPALGARWIRSNESFKHHAKDGLCVTQQQQGLPAVSNDFVARPEKHTSRCRGDTKAALFVRILLHWKECSSLLGCCYYCVFITTA